MNDISIDDKLFCNRFKIDTESHLLIKDQKTCIEKCGKKPCLNFCPANVYKNEEDRSSVNYDGCLECGPCRIACPYLNIEWNFPKGGYGISHKFG
jgi:ferredoxin like protein